MTEHYDQREDVVDNIQFIIDECVGIGNTPACRKCYRFRYVKLEKRMKELEKIVEELKTLLNR